MGNLKPLVYKDYNFFYERKVYKILLGEPIVHTRFYLGSELVNTKKYLLFGPTVQKEVPTFVFELDIDIFSKNVTLEQLKKELDKGINIIEKRDAVRKGVIK